jgi:hypothetical protein
MGQILVPLVNIKIAGKWMFIPLKMDPRNYKQGNCGKSFQIFFIGLKWRSEVVTPRD